MQAFVEYVARGLVDHPDEVSVSAAQRNGMTIYELRVAAGDVGKVIGRKGTTIQAIRSLVQVGGAKAGRRCSVDLLED
ncbi:MAG: KH domain-containing protein [Verrucomicrobia bacterium]|nr:MAG: KH domain-containing protein [Verrucomicrobiota bacterium]